MARTTVFIIIFSITIQAFGQQGPGPVSEFSFRFSNDFTHSSDQYYSNGFYVEIIDPVLTKNPVNYLLFAPGKEALVYNSITLTQDFFTPNFNVDFETSRPFASYLLLGAKQLVIMPDKKMRITSELQIGLIGTNSGGEYIQNTTHAIFPAAEPVSWANQIRNDIGLNYRVLIEKQAFHADYVQILLHGEAQAGTPYTQVSGGAKLQLGLFENYFMAKGTYSRNWQVYLYNDVTGYGVLHNSTIQGGVFAENPYIREDLNNWLMNIETGVGVGYKNAIFEIGQHLLTPEFAAGDIHKWGYFNLKVRF